MNWIIRPRSLFLGLTYTTAGLTLTNLILLMVSWITGSTRMMGFMALFRVGKESNIPTWYSALLLLLAAALLHTIALGKQASSGRHASHWRVLSIVFLLMSVDEASAVHERIGELIGRLIPLQVLVDYGWAVPGIALAGVVGLSFTRLVMSLPAETRNLFIVAGVLFLGGASGMELISLKWGHAHGMETISYQLLTVIEEFLEMMGVVVLIYALASYVARHMDSDSVKIRFLGGTSDSDA